MPTFESHKQLAFYLRESMAQGIEGDIKDAIQGAVKFFQSPLLSVLSKQDDDNKQKNLVFQNKQLLQVAEEYLQTKPWITYFASLKHILLLKSKGVSPANFNDFRDKEYALEVEEYAERLAISAEKLLDEDTKVLLQELIMLQQVVPLIPQSIVGLKSFARIYRLRGERKGLLKDEKQPFMEKLFFGIFFGPSLGDPAVAIHRHLITAAAEGLKQKPEDWICSPLETIEYLEQLPERRVLLEETYLQF
jgi:hypothetical protein